MTLGREDQLKHRILSILQTEDGSTGLPISRIADRVSVSVATASKFCHILAAEKRVDITKFGDMKLVRRRG
jgi:DNA-binding MurR/RpiR family transcriptional regulator